MCDYQSSGSDEWEEFFEVISGVQAGDIVVAGPYQRVRELTDSTAVQPSETSEVQLEGLSGKAGDGDGEGEGA